MPSKQAAASLTDLACACVGGKSRTIAARTPRRRHQARSNSRATRRTTLVTAATTINLGIGTRRAARAALGGAAGTAVAAGDEARADRPARSRRRWPTLATREERAGRRTASMPRSDGSDCWRRPTPRDCRTNRSPNSPRPCPVGRRHALQTPVAEARQRARSSGTSASRSGSPCSARCSISPKCWRSLLPAAARSRHMERAASSNEAAR